MMYGMQLSRCTFLLKLGLMLKPCKPCRSHAEESPVGYKRKNIEL